MTTSFPGVLAGKMTFRSTQRDGKAWYLTAFRSSDGEHGWIYTPSMNAATPGPTERHILYVDSDTYYRIQTGDLLHWLAYEDGYGFGYREKYSGAARFSLEGSPPGSQLFVHTAAGRKQISYTISGVADQPNWLGTASGEGTYATFAVETITPSLAQIRRDKRALKADLSGTVLIDQDLSGIDCTGATFVKAQVSGLKLNGATLDQADLSGTDLRGLAWGTPRSARGMVLTGSVLGACEIGDSKATDRPDCTGAQFSTADLTGAKLHWLNLQQAKFSGATLNGALFDHCGMQSAHLDGVVALRARFLYADLTDLSAQAAILTQAVFDHSDLTRVRMGASSYLFDLEAACATDLNTHQYPTPTVAAAFKSRGVSLRNDAPCEVLDKGSKWLIHDVAGPYKLLLTERKAGEGPSTLAIQVFNDNPSLIPAILRGASCRGVTAPGASLSGADLRGVRWYAQPATLENADLEEAVFAGALLVGTTFTQAHLFGADFSDSVLIQAHLDGCVAGPGASRRAISFEGAHLEGVKLAKSSFSGAILTGAVVALGPGVPLLALPKSDQQYLTAARLSHLVPAFKQAGVDLGSKPAVADLSSWHIDNSLSKQPNAPSSYDAKLKTDNSAFDVFSKGSRLFSLLLNQSALLDQLAASQPLCALFRNSNYDLVLGAPITRAAAWTISAGDDAAYLRPYRFPKLQVQPDGDVLRVYGVQPVLIEKVPEYPDGVHFDPTSDQDSAFSQNSIGPAGVPFAWIAPAPLRIDAERFWTADLATPD
jgi:uncharacterized protein YjbI with pentapeptide repeats